MSTNDALREAAETALAALEKKNGHWGAGARELEQSATTHDKLLSDALDAALVVLRKGLSPRYKKIQAAEEILSEAQVLHARRINDAVLNAVLQDHREEMAAVESGERLAIQKAYAWKDKCAKKDAALKAFVDARKKTLPSPVTYRGRTEFLALSMIRFQTDATAAQTRDTR